ncbi:MAG: ATPase domain-containing protein [Euryarchaeota archaeon]|nr:ATPase domain-containing protein [Euryarchaeota archaeon]
MVKDAECKRKTYIPMLDELLGGGMPAGTSILFTSMPGITSEVFGYQIIAERMRNERDVCFIYTNTRTPVEIEHVFQRYGWDLRSPLDSGQAFFVDSISPMMGMPAIGRYVVDDFAESEETVTNAISDIAGGTAVIDNIATLLDSIGVDQTFDLIERLNKEARSNDVDMVYMFTRWNYEKVMLDRLSDIVDCEIKLFSVEEKVIYRQVFAITKSNWIKTSGSKIFFEVLEPGGVRVFIPKLLVTGPYNAGKTTFAHAIAPDTVSVERQTFELFPTTVGLDIGHVDYKGFSADVFGTPGQERFDLLLEPLGREAIGTFVVIDSTKPETFVRAKEMIRMCRTEAIPKVIIANKQDLPNALSPDEIKKRMALWEDVPIVPVSAANKQGLDEALDILFSLIYRV